ncbi:hypothetical protein PRIC1_009959 [Phytophthora ramorum]
MPPLLESDFFGDALLSKYWPSQNYDDLLADATAEWYLYREQLITSAIEPPLAQRFPDKEEFEQLNPSVFDNCRYAYFDKKTNMLVDEPLHPDDQTLTYNINNPFTTDDLWQDQPIAEVCVEEYIQLPLDMDPILTSIMPMTPLLLGDITDIDSIMTEDERASSAASGTSELSD